MHQKLKETVAPYRKWHSTKYASVVHFCLLIVFATLFAESLVQGIEASNQSAAASSALRAEGRPDHKGSVVSFGGDRVIIKFKENAGQARRNAILAEKKLTKKSRIEQIDVDVVTVGPDETAEEVVQSLLRGNRNDIEFVEVDVLMEPALTPNDPSFSSQWNKKLPNLPIAWDRTTGASSVVVGVADTGVDCTHPDLVANCVAGWNFYDNNSNTADVYGHGTPVAGVIAAVGNNSLNVVGSAWNVKIMPLRISQPDGLAYSSVIAQAVIYAADRGVKVVNNSYASVDKSSTLQSAAQYLFNKGGIFVGSAGNTSGATGITTNNAYYLIAAGSTSSDTKYSWSSYGANVDIAAPGCSVSTARGGGTRSFCGTSNAAPEVSGLLALMFSLKPDLSPATMRDALFSSAKDLGATGWDQYFGWGRIQADKALDAIAGLAGNPPPAADTTAPSVPQALSASAVSSSQINLSWTKSTDAVGVTGYNVYRGGSKVWSGATNGYSDTKVSPSTSYSYTVSAYDAAGNASAQTSAVSATTPAAPVAALGITSFSVSAKSGTTATVSWTTNQASSGLVRFGVQSNNLSGQVTSSATGTTHSATLTGLKAKTKYFYQIEVSASGATAKSAVSSFRTAAK